MRNEEYEKQKPALDKLTVRQIIINRMKEAAKAALEAVKNLTSR